MSSTKSERGIKAGGAGNGTQDRFTVENLSRIRREKTQIRTSLTLANVLTMF